jgi:hypothetical protein
VKAVRQVLLVAACAVGTLSILAGIVVGLLAMRYPGP